MHFLLTNIDQYLTFIAQLPYVKRVSVNPKNCLYFLRIKSNIFFFSLIIRSWIFHIRVGLQVIRPNVKLKRIGAQGVQGGKFFLADVSSAVFKAGSYRAGDNIF